MRSAITMESLNDKVVTFSIQSQIFHDASSTNYDTCSISSTHTTKKTRRRNLRQRYSFASTMKKGVALWYIAVLIAIFASFASARRISRDFGDNNSAVYRPEPSEDLDLPIVDLIEHPDGKYNPPGSHVNGTYLRERLGTNFDPWFMSVNDPRTVQTLDRGFPSGYKKNKRGKLLPAGNIPNRLRKINFRFITLPNGRRVKTKLGRKQNRKFQRLLWQYTYCPVLYFWRDLGVRFWPRWIKQGRCSRRKSCSVPPGMNCKPKKSVSKTLLRWHCQNWETKQFCKWIPVKYPIITECACAC